MAGKKSRYGYMPYTGPKGYVFFRALGRDLTLADEVACGLADKRVRLFYDYAGGREAARPKDVTDAIIGCERTIFMLSAEACESLDFRNSINYALKLNKKVICIKLDSFTPTHGLDMQLANVPMISKKGAGHIIEELEKADFTPEMVKGDDVVPKEVRKLSVKQKRVLAAAIAIFLIAGSLTIKIRSDHLNSPEYVLKDADNAEYVDISRFDESVLGSLEGYTIDTLNMDGMGAEDISAISAVNVREVNIAHNPDVSSLKPIAKCSGIEKVTVSQDMIEKAEPLTDAGITVKVVE